MPKNKQRIRLLHAVGMMNRGGAETMIMNIFRNIDREKYEFNFLTHSSESGAFDEEIKKLGGTIYSLPSLGTLGYVRYVIYLFCFIKANGPFDIIHSHLDWQGGAIAVAARLAGVKKIIVHSHSSSWQKPYTLPYRLLYRFSRLGIALFASNGWACSQSAGEFLFPKRWIYNGKYQKIPNAIDLAAYKNLNADTTKEMRKRLDISEQTIIYGHVGSFSRPKNHEFLLELASWLKMRNWDFCFVFIGDGALRGKIQSQVNDKNLGKQIKFLGIQENIPECMNFFDVFLFPSLFEGLGIAVVEAQAAGIPCFVSNRVPYDVDMQLDLVEYLPIDSVEPWIEALTNAKIRRCYDRLKIEQQITNMGFNVRDSVKEVANLYDAINDERESN
jgi:glycosyltransferase EpsF